MQIWNQAQVWFAKTYFPNSSVYTFTEAGARYVHVIWVPYSPTYGGRTGASSCMTNDVEGTIGVNCSVTIVLTYRNGTNLASALILHGALHEFGHVLGLNHPDSDIIPDDLMNPEKASNAMTPSTLDLYAVHLLANAVGTTSRLSAGVVTLPAYIPYATYGSDVTTSYTTFSKAYFTSSTVSITGQGSAISGTVLTTANLSSPSVADPTIYIIMLIIIGVIAITGLYLRRKIPFSHDRVKK